MKKISETLKKIAKSLKCYLTDWRNLLTHSIVGIVLAVLAVWAPIPLHGKISMISIIVLFNLVRMKRNKPKPI
jgi:hypothetical protein